MKKMNQKGMTLIEILAVIVILGIFSAILAPSVGQVMSDNEKRQHLTNAMKLKEIAMTMVEAGMVEGTKENQNKFVPITKEELLKKGWLKSGELLNPSNHNQPYDDIQIKVSRLKGVYYYDLILSGQDKDGTPHTYIDTTGDDDGGNEKHLGNLELSDIHVAG